MTLPIILASKSPARLDLLKQIKITPSEIIPSDIDETEKRGETARLLALRLAEEKGVEVARRLDKGIIISADTVPVCGRRIMRKAKSADDVRESMRLLSGRRHQIYTGVCVIKKTKDELVVRRRVVKTIVKFKLISDKEIKYFASLDEGINKAGGYTISGYAESFVSFISGSFSNVIGLPLFETSNMLKSVGVDLATD